MKIFVIVAVIVVYIIIGIFICSVLEDFSDYIDPDYYFLLIAILWPIVLLIELIMESRNLVINIKNKIRKEDEKR